MDPFEFLLARDLGRTLAELRLIDQAEYLEWRAFYVWETAMTEFEAQKARARGQRRQG